MSSSTAMTPITTILLRLSLYFTCWKVSIPVSTRISTHHHRRSRCLTLLLIVENRTLHEVLLAPVDIAEHHVLLRLHRHLHRLDLIGCLSRGIPQFYIPCRTASTPPLPAGSIEVRTTGCSTRSAGIPNEATPKTCGILFHA